MNFNCVQCGGSSEIDVGTITDENVHDYGGYVWPKCHHCGGPCYAAPYIPLQVTSTEISKQLGEGS